MPLRENIEQLAARASGNYSDEDFAQFDQFKAALNRGEIRAAESDADGNWRTNAWVKRGILLGFRMGQIIEMTPSGAPLQFLDKNTYPIRRLSPDDRVRIVPGGSSIRDGAYIAPGVVCMPPMFVNAGAYVDEGTMVDSHALVGSCAQIGKRVHISAAAQTGLLVSMSSFTQRKCRSRSMLRKASSAACAISTGSPRRRSRTNASSSTSPGPPARLSFRARARFKLKKAANGVCRSTLP